MEKIQKGIVASILLFFLIIGSHLLFEIQFSIGFPVIILLASGVSSTVIQWREGKPLVEQRDFEVIVFIISNIILLCVSMFVIFYIFGYPLFPPQKY
ncbi:MAG: hypothetical protein AB1333_03335 [Patescibacteria group bacterium]